MRPSVLTRNGIIRTDGPSFGIKMRPPVPTRNGIIRVLGRGSKLLESKRFLKVFLI